MNNREALERIAAYPSNRSEEMSIETAREIARAALASQAQQTESQWISVMDCELKNNDTIYAHRSSGEVIEAVYKFWKDHKNPHRIISSEFGNESINNYKNVMTRKVISLPPAPVSANEQPEGDKTK